MKGGIINFDILKDKCSESVVNTVINNVNNLYGRDFESFFLDYIYKSLSDQEKFYFGFLKGYYPMAKGKSRSDYEDICNKILKFKSDLVYSKVSEELQVFYLNKLNQELNTNLLSI